MPIKLTKTIKLHHLKLHLHENFVMMHSIVPPKTEVRLTEDGSPTLYLPELNEHYHSVHGAVQESKLIFIEYGFNYFEDRDELCIFEVGFGTGLNAALTAIEAGKTKKRIQYIAGEPFPLSPEIIEAYGDLLAAKHPGLSEPFAQLHLAPWDSGLSEALPEFWIEKFSQSFSAYKPANKQFDLVYFDAFAPDLVPDMWTQEAFAFLYNILKPSGVLVTYSAKGSVKRALRAAGFFVEGLPGPPGKREVTRAIKNDGIQTNE